MSWLSTSIDGLFLAWIFSFLFHQGLSPKRLITYYALCWILNIGTCTLSLLGHEEGVLIVHEYDQKYLCPMLVRWYEQLHCMQESPSASQLVPRETHVGSGLDIFDIANSSGELTKECELRVVVILMMTI
jgi:hypothetical protein